MMIRLTPLLISLLVIVPGLARGDETGDKDNAIKREMKLLEGSWEKVSRVADGEEVPRLPGEGPLRLTLKEGKFTIELKDGKVVDDGTFKIDPTVKPKSLDMSGKGGNEMPGVYELTKDELTICSAPRGKGRPTKVESGKGSGYIIDTWKRIK
jgi:uncharacterized protein (TIGR03067 family)